MVAVVNVFSTLLERLDGMFRLPARWLAHVDDGMAEIWEPFLDDPA